MKPHWTIVAGAVLYAVLDQLRYFIDLSSSTSETSLSFSMVLNTFVDLTPWIFVGYLSQQSPIINSLLAVILSYLLYYGLFSWVLHGSSYLLIDSLYILSLFIRHLVFSAAGGALGFYIATSANKSFKRTPTGAA